MIRKTLIIAGIVLIVGMVSIYVLFNTLETKENSYETYSAAGRVGAIGEGRWIPSLLPHSSTNIKELHKIDSNWTIVKFSYGINDISGVVSECSPLNVQDVVYPVATQARLVSWWPADLKTNTQNAETNKRYKFYKCPETQIYAEEGSHALSTWMAVDEKNLTAFIWRQTN